MLVTKITDLDSLDKLNSKVELYKSSTSTLIKECTCADFLETFSIDREGDTSKFFGFGIVHKMQCTLIDIDRVLTLSNGDTVKIAYGNEEAGEWDYPYPTFYITECSRDEKSNSITFTAYDKLYFATAHTLEELNLVAPYTPRNVLDAACSLLGLPGVYIGTPCNTAHLTNTFSEGANFGGDEDLRQVLNYVAEYTGNIYYLNNNNRLRYKSLVKNGAAVANISKDNYYELSVKEHRTLKSICATTELGDNLTPTTAVTEGVTQYLKDNPFLNLNDSAASQLESLGAWVQGVTITQLDCDWEGNHLLEIGDKLGVVGTDGTTHYTYLLNDRLTYAGYLNQVTEWEYTQDNAETAVHSNNISEIINETYAKVDKVNKEITLYVGETNNRISDVQDTVSEITEKVSQLEVTADGITETVSNTQTKVDDLGTVVESITNEVSTKVTAEQVEFIVTTELAEGVDKVITTSKNYTFDDEGLNISSSDSNISTTISENGMNIYRQGTEVLTADNEGVKAEDLHATTYLIIGNNSRFEDYVNVDGEHRTACFWVGG
ncbi:MAG: hypothetical protein IKB64_03460 [Paludibacteraceae bacterium]|nr:hypothetical protein [Paludibacteraceae bacterium]